jgi:hypothetical protein
MSLQFLQKKIKPDGEGLVNCLKYAGTPSRVHFIELYLDREIEDAVCSRFNLLDPLDKSDSYFEYKRYMAVLGGIDVDFLCRATHDAIRARVRDTINSCQQGGGFCLGTGNTVANYIPLNNYLVMLDEGRLWGM